MNLVFAVPLLLALGCAWYVGRRIARRRALRRQQARRERNERMEKRSFTPVKSKRSQMRTDDDPTTVMERISETRPPASASQPKSGTARK